MKDYYTILGVSRDADSAEIRDAYRGLAKRSHPDSSRCDATTREFIDVQEAYDALRSSGRRQDYDRRYDALRRRQRGRAGRSVGSPVSLDMELDLILSRQESLRGGVFEIPTRADLLCPVCGGVGYRLLFPCLACSGRGVVSGVLSVTVEIPRGVATGDHLVGRIRRGVELRPAADIRVVVR